MKKLYLLIIAVLTLSIGFSISPDVAASETTTAATTTTEATTTVATTVDVYDSTNLAVTLGGITYTDPELEDGWYHMEIAADGLDNPAGLLTISYYTDDLVTGHNFYDSTYTDNVITVAVVAADVYVINGVFKISTSEIDTFDEILLETNFTLTTVAEASTTPGTITPPTEVASWLGVAWYWWTVFGVVAIYFFGFTKEGKKIIGLK